MTFCCSSCAITYTVKENTPRHNLSAVKKMKIYFTEKKSFFFTASVISNSCYLEAVNLIKYHKLKADVLHLIATHVSIITWITPFLFL